MCPLQTAGGPPAELGRLPQVVKINEDLVRWDPFADPHPLECGLGVSLANFELLAASSVLLLSVP